MISSADLHGKIIKTSINLSRSAQNKRRLRKFQDRKHLNSYWGTCVCMLSALRYRHLVAHLLIGQANISKTYLHIANFDATFGICNSRFFGV